MKAKATRRILALLLSLVMVLALLPTLGAGASFTDVKDGSWYKEAVDYCEENGLMSGTGDGAFSPKATVTRETVIKTLHNMQGSPAPEGTENFSDAKEGKWYCEALQWAKDTGLAAGTGSNKFGVGQSVTRQELATFFFRYADEIKQLPIPELDDLAVFSDKDAVADWAKNAMGFAVASGILSGKGQKDGSALLAPTDTATRAELASILMRVDQYVKENSEVKITFPSTSNEWIAKYGNIYTDCTAEQFAEMGFGWGDIVTVSFLDQTLDLPVVPTFSYVDSGTPGIFVNKDGETGEMTGNVFMAINMGNFAEAYGLAKKTVNEDKSYYWTAVEGVEFPVEVRFEMKEAGGYATQMAIRDINRTNNREDYPELSDAEFANFRQITTTGMGDHLYRGSSPINPEIGRNTYADKALEDAGVTVIMNLANDKATAESYEGFSESYYSKQNVIYLNLGVDFFADEFKTGLANGLRHFAENKGVYYVHCTEGKDRAGFVSALLECFMGAEYDEVVDDYLTTYRNYYSVIDGKQVPLAHETLYAIADSNIVKSLQRAFEVEDLTSADLAQEARDYIASLGLSDEEIDALHANLAEQSALHAELTMNEYLTLELYDWFATGKTDYTVQAKMVSEDTEVYNALEDVSYVAHPNGEDVILKGSLGEEWVTKLSKVAKTYKNLDGSEITAEDFATLDTYIEIRTIPTSGNFAYFIPKEYKVSVETAWGDTLHANRDGIEHGDGDYLVCSAGEDGKPDLSDVWVVNGAQFVKNYDLTNQIV